MSSFADELKMRTKTFALRIIRMAEGFCRGGVLDMFWEIKYCVPRLPSVRIAGKRIARAQGRNLWQKSAIACVKSRRSITGLNSLPKQTSCRKKLADPRRETGELIGIFASIIKTRRATEKTILNF